MAQNPWDVVSETPSPASPQAAPTPQGKGDEWKVVSEQANTPAQPAQPQGGQAQPSWYDRAKTAVLGDNTAGGDPQMTGMRANVGAEGTVLAGAIKSALQVPQTLGANINSAETDVKGVKEHVGSMIENIAEYVAGDEALKGLSAAAKLSEVAKIATFVEKHPTIAKMLGGGLRAGVVGTGQAAAHGESAGDALKTGAITGGVGAAAELAGAGIGALSKQAKKANTTFEIAGQEGRVGARAIPPEGQATSKDLDQGIRKIATDTIVPPEEAQADPHYHAAMQSGVDEADARDVFEYAAFQVKHDATDLYKAIDKQTGGLWQTNQNAIDAVERGIRSATDDQALAKLMARRAELETEHATILQIAKENGVPETDIAKAKKLYRQQSALLDLNKQVEMSTSGIRPHMVEDNIAHAGEAPVPGQTIPKEAAEVLSPETIDPNKLEPRLQKLYNSGRLQDAVGADQAEQMILLAELMKQRQALAKGLDVAFASTLAHHPMTATGHLVLSTAKDMWGAILNNPKATAIAITGLKAGIPATKLAPALMNYQQMQMQDRQQQSGPRSAAPSPDTHRFSVAQWQQANPNGDPEEAKAEAAKQGYMVVA